MTSLSAVSSEPADRRACARAALDALLARYASRHAACDEALIDGLFVDDAAGRLAAISELSVSYRAGQPTTVRALSEVVRRRPLDRAVALRGMQWGTNLLRRLGCDAALFRELYGTFYLRAPEASALFRFGIALELGGAAPVMKTYFDLHAVQADLRPHALRRVAESVADAAGLDAFLRACPQVDAVTTRVIGVDFSPIAGVRSKFYWSARHLDWDGIAALSRELSGERHLDTLARLRDVCADGALAHTLVSMCADAGTRSLKLDVCLARMFEDDARACAAVRRLCGFAADDETPYELVTGGADPRVTRCVHQYAGVELAPSRDARVTLYYRPLGLDTEYLNPALRPRRIA